MKQHKSLAIAAFLVAAAIPVGCAPALSPTPSAIPLLNVPQQVTQLGDLGANSGKTITFKLNLGGIKGFATKAELQRTWADVTSIDFDLVPNDNSDPANNPNGVPNYDDSFAGGAALTNDYSAATPLAGSAQSRPPGDFTGAGPYNNTFSYSNVPLGKWRLRVKAVGAGPTQLSREEPANGPAGPSRRFAVSSNFADTGSPTTNYVPVGSGALDVSVFLQDGVGNTVGGNVTVNDGAAIPGLGFTP